MKGRGKRLFVRLVLLLILMQPVCVQAAGAVQETTRLQTSEVGQEAKAAQEAAYIQAADASAEMTEETDQMTDELLEELELDEMERFLNKQQQEEDRKSVV